MKRTQLTNIVGAFVVLGLQTTLVSANGYHFLHQSAEGMGTAYASNAAGGNDISAMFSNPSSIARFDGTRISGGFVMDFPTSSLDNGVATAPFTAGATAVTGSSVSDQPIDTAFGAASYATHEYEPGIVFGVSVGAPFAYISEYSDTAVSRYTATKTVLQAPNVSPTIAIKVNDQLSLGASLNFQYYKAEIGTQVATSLTPSVATDVTSHIEAGDFAVGFSLGLEYQMTEATRIGLSYRSAIDHSFDGTVALTGSTANLTSLVALAAANGVTISSFNGRAKFDISTPSMFQVGLVHQVDDKFEIYANANRFGWSKFKDTTIEFSNGLTDSIVDNNWNDSWFVALGGGYQYSDKIKLRAGAAYDWTPTPADTVSPRAPNNDRWNVGLGLSYQKDDQWKFDFGYQYIKFKEITMALAGGNNVPRGTLDANVNLYAHVFMAQVNYKF